MDDLVKVKVGRVEYSVPKEAELPIKTYIGGTFSLTPEAWSIYINVWDAKYPSRSEFIDFFPTTHYIVQITTDLRVCVDDCPVNYHYIVIDDKGWKSFNSPETFNSFISAIPVSVNADNIERYAKLVFSLLYTNKSRYRSGWSVDTTTAASLTIENKAYMVRMPIVLSVFGPFHPKGDVYHGLAFLSINDRGAILSFRQE
jgi:hypothetical protein